MSETKKPEAFFDKVVFGGYDTVQVDEFVIEAKKLSRNTKDNALLTQKLKILADEINAGRSATAKSGKNRRAAAGGTEP